MMTPSTRALATTLGGVLLAGGLLAGGCATRPQVSITNNTDTMLGYRVWVGERSAAGGVVTAQMRADDAYAVKPGATSSHWIASATGYKSAAESFVRVQMWTIGASFDQSHQYWFELVPPTPYSFQVDGEAAAITADHPGPGRVVAVPREGWILNAPVPEVNTQDAGTPTK